MGKDIIIYIVLVIISMFIYWLLLKRKCSIIRREKENLEIQKETSKRLVCIFYKILNNK